MYLDLTFGTWVAVPHVSNYSCAFYDPPPFSGQWPTQCTVGGVAMHCCPPGNAMVGVHLDANTFKCAPLRSPGGEVTLDTGTVRNDMHVCPFGQVMVGLHTGKLDEGRLYELAPTVLGEANAGDAVAVAIVERQADEAAVLVNTALRRLRLRRSDADVVLGGGVARARSPVFMRRLAALVHACAPDGSPWWTTCRSSARPCSGSTGWPCQTAPTPACAAFSSPPSSSETARYPEEEPWRGSFSKT